MLDSDGYPDQKSLDEIESFKLGDGNKELCKFVNLIRSNWWADDWGFKYHFDTGCLELHTGGWSGNEDVISAIKKQKWFWFWFWEMSKRGGHYWFKLYQFDKNGKQCIPRLSQ